MAWHVFNNVFLNIIKEFVDCMYSLGSIQSTIEHFKHALSHLLYVKYNTNH